MFAHKLARFAVVIGILFAANGCCHCGSCKPGLVDCLVGGSCNDCDTGCNTGCTSCGGGHRSFRNTPQFGGETYQGCACGEAYHGDWKSHPPCADPCDCYGNNTGCANSCQSCQHLNRGRYCGLKGFFKSMLDGCDDCDEGCTSCGKGGCATKGCTSCGH